MTQTGSSEEADHFEQVLGRLDALLKRGQPVSPPILETPQEDATETSDSAIPVLTEIYQGEVAAPSLSIEDLPAPVLTESMEVPEQPIEPPIESTAEHLSPQAADQPAPQSIEQFVVQAETHLPESEQLFDEPHAGNLESVMPGAAPQPLSTVDSDAVVEKTLAVLMPLLQETLDRIVGEEIERALSRARTGVAERLHGEVREEIEWVLRERLREVLIEGRD